MLKKILALTFLCHAPAMAFTFVTLDSAMPAGTQNVALEDVNRAGVAVGSYQDAGGAWHGFTYNRGVVTTNSFAYNLSGINDAGDVAGSYLSGGRSWAYYTAGGSSFGTGGGGDFYGFDINNNGVKVGQYWPGGNDSGTRAYGIVMPPSAGFSIYPDPEPGTVGGVVNSGMGDVSALNDLGMYGGTFYNAAQGWPAGAHGWYRDASGNYYLSDPDGGSGLASSVTGINNSGVIVGEWGNFAGVTQGYIKTAAGYTFVNYPGTPYRTTVNGINDFGTIVGTYTLTAGGPKHAFIAYSEQGDPAWLPAPSLLAFWKSL